MSATKRIPVSEETWKQLGDMKEDGETYDELLAKLVQAHRREELAEKARRAREMDAEDVTSIDDV